ncbi:MAG: cupin domain-containing protein, partial [Methylotenera sp.]
GTNAFLKDVVGNTNKNMPFTCGLFRMEAGKSLTYTYDYDEAKVILEGTMTVTDGTTTAKVVPGDVLYFPKGSTITFSSQTKGVGFICGNREIGAA